MVILASRSLLKPDNNIINHDVPAEKLAIIASVVIAYDVNLSYLFGVCFHKAFSQSYGIQEAVCFGDIFPIIVSQEHL
eukprot:5327231-Amphidinium_carterae.1